MAWSATSSMKVSGTLVTGNAPGGRRRHVDIVGADRAERDDLAALQPVDHALGEGAALGIDRVGIVRGVDERVLRGGVDLDDLDAERLERLVLDTRSRRPRPRSSCPWA